VIEDNDYEFLQEAEDFKNEQFNYEKEENLIIENLVNLNAKNIISDLDKKM
ncbi:6464_t:CDS:1, partial [Funneliformis mosseae]